MSGAEELHLFDSLVWRLSEALSGTRHGGHRGKMRGAGENFADVVPLARHPDPRRLDLRRSIADPFGQVFARRFEARTDLTLHVLLDLSASLATGANADRHGLAAMLTAGLSRAARRGGDLFGLAAVAGDQALVEIPPARRPLPAEEIMRRIAELKPTGRGVEGLLRATASLPHDRLLVSLISDFEYAPDELDRLLTALRPRPVLPLWLRDSGLEAPPGGFGLADLRDPETGRSRVVLTTKSWAERQTRDSAARRAELRRVFGRHGLRAVEVVDQIRLGDLSAALAEAPL